VAGAETSTAVLIEPDLAFIRTLRENGADTLKNCFQCGTCSAVCALSPDRDPFPRKEMAWAAWGRKAELLRDPDIWLCHQCNDCATRCPRGAKPGQVLGAVRQVVVSEHAFPGRLARWMAKPHYFPLLLAIPCILLTLALVVRDPIEEAFGLSPQAGDRILYAYSSLFPHWMLNAFFIFFTVLAFLAILVGVVRLWNSLRVDGARGESSQSRRRLVPSIGSVLKTVVTHDHFTQCTTARARFFSHAAVFFGFVALTLVSIWVVAGDRNPLNQNEFIYPLGFFTPWKLLANVGGLALIGGCALMIVDRFRNADRVGSGSYADWALLAQLILATLTGFITEALHFLHLEPHRHVAYFVHLVFVFAVLIYMPYSKLAHLAYRATAMVFAERMGRSVGARNQPTGGEATERQEGADDV